MCIIVPRVDRVANTNLFARLTESGSQVLVYQMSFSAQQTVAMVLPLPMALPACEDAVRFIDLKGYPEFFAHCNKGFPMPRSQSIGRSMTASVSPAPQSLLRVEDVGDFEASFVPTVAHFQRIDPRFRLPEETFEKLPEYGDYGFVVFQFKELGGKPHPMAFEFPTRLQNTLFYPTVHVHDGEIHNQERFDHNLYLQGDTTQGAESAGNAARFLQLDKAQDIVHGTAPLRRVQLSGTLPNTDTVIDLTPQRPRGLAKLTSLLFPKRHV